MNRSLLSIVLLAAIATLSFAQEKSSGSSTAPTSASTITIENRKFKEVDGVLVPMSFSQRFEMPQGAFFAEYSVKEAKLNQTLGDDAFAIPN